MRNISNFYTQNFIVEQEPQGLSRKITHIQYKGNHIKKNLILIFRSFLRIGGTQGQN